MGLILWSVPLLSTLPLSKCVTCEWVFVSTAVNGVASVSHQHVHDSIVSNKRGSRLLPSAGSSEYNSLLHTCGEVTSLTIAHWVKAAWQNKQHQLIWSSTGFLGTILNYISFSRRFYPKRLTISAFNHESANPEQQESSKYKLFIFIYLILSYFISQVMGGRAFPWKEK